MSVFFYENYCFAFKPVPLHVGYARFDIRLVPWVVYFHDVGIGQYTSMTAALPLWVIRLETVRRLMVPCIQDGALPLDKLLTVTRRWRL